MFLARVQAVRASLCDACGGIEVRRGRVDPALKGRARTRSSLCDLRGREVMWRWRVACGVGLVGELIRRSE